MKGVERIRLEVLQVQQDLLPIINQLAALEFDMMPTTENELLRDTHMRLAAASATLSIMTERLDNLRERRDRLSGEALATDLSHEPTHR